MYAVLCWVDDQHGEFGEYLYPRIFGGYLACWLNNMQVCSRPAGGRRMYLARACIHLIVQPLFRRSCGQEMTMLSFK